MPRRTKAEIALEKLVDRVCNRACLNLSINIMNLSKISDAAKNAAAQGEEEAYKAARAVAESLHEAV